MGEENNSERFVSLDIYKNKFLELMEDTYGTEYKIQALEERYDRSQDMICILTREKFILKKIIALVDENNDLKSQLDEFKKRLCRLEDEVKDLKSQLNTK